MAKKPVPKKEVEENIHIEVESWQWEEKSPRFTWKHWLILALLIAVGLLFAFGFLVVAGVVLIIGIVLNLVYFIFRKLT
ncbi:MAG: hypothetical protein JNJ47_03115 [Alphaproteobacteria bacterium]|nr:hypothetical protein [Alphaproteobacteria bacterium]